MKRSGNVFKYRYHTLRSKLSQPLFWSLVFLGPILDVFRVDMIEQRLVVLGRHLPFEFGVLMWLPVGFYGAVILIGIVSFIWGRLFCGWTCPHNTLTEWTRPLRAVFDPGGNREEKPRWMKLALRDRPWLKQVFWVVSPLLAMALTFTLSLLLCFYVVPPDFVLAQYAGGHPHIALVWGNMLFMLIGLFLLYAGHDFCRTCCPYGMGQSVSAYHENSRWRPMEIQFTGDKASQCKTCQACRMVCPVDLDPRDGTLTGGFKLGQFDGCFNCGECIDACKYLHSFKQAPSLLKFGHPGFRKKSTAIANAIPPEGEASLQPSARTQHPKHLFPVGDSTDLPVAGSFSGGES
jgi:ferredoxin-type protein NapH